MLPSPPGFTLGAMGDADDATELVLRLRHEPDRGPCGTLRGAGSTQVRAFDGWLGLIGLITDHVEIRRSSDAGPSGVALSGSRALDDTREGASVDHSTTMRQTYERISAGDLDGFAALVADDFVEHDEIPGLPPTKDGLLDYFRMLLAAFPDLRLDVEDLLADGDKTVARLTASATHGGEFMGIPATGKRVEMGLIDIMAFDGAGLVREHWGVADMLSLLQQLGAVPA
jgi:steroid delta-isomerase-like uncharacterized protein